MIDPAGRRQHNTTRVILLAHIAAQIFAAEARNALRRSEDRAPDGLVWIGRFLEMIENDVVRRIVGLPDFLDHHRFLAFQFLGVEYRVLQQIANDIDRKRHIIFQYPGEKGGLFTRGIGVQVPADRLDLLGDIASTAPHGAFEGHVFDEMGDAVQRGALVARPGIDPNADRRCRKMRRILAHHPQAVVQPRDPGLRHQAARARLATKACTVAKSFVTTSNRSSRVVRSAKRAGNAGRTPVASSTASGNFAGCAVAR